MVEERVKAWWISIDVPPGYVNTFVTPCRSRVSTRMFEPLRGSAEVNRDTKGSDVANPAVVVVAAEGV